MRWRLSRYAWLLVLIPVATGITVAVRAGGQEVVTFDHLKCFLVKDFDTPNERLTADLTPENPLFDEQHCRIKHRASYLCVDAAKSNVQSDGQPYPTDDVGGGNARDYICYYLTCPGHRDVPRIETHVRDQFGDRTIFVQDADFFCAPAVKGTGGPTPEPPTPTPTPTLTSTPTLTPTPTATATPVPCGLQDRTCGGDCPTSGDLCLFNGEVCACVAPESACALQPQTTGNTDICGGLCPGIDEDCVPGPGMMDKAGGGPRADLAPCVCVLGN